MGKGQRVRNARNEKRLDTIRRASTEVRNVIVRCPTTDKFFPTGVACDAESFVSSTFENNVTQCPLCGQKHRWGDSEIALDN